MFLGSVYGVIDLGRFVADINRAACVIYPVFTGHLILDPTPSKGFLLRRSQHRLRKADKATRALTSFHQEEAPPGYHQGFR